MCMRGVMGAPKKNSILLLVFEFGVVELPVARAAVARAAVVIVGGRYELGLGLGLGHEEDEEATCGRVEYGRSARRSDCCDDGPLTFTRRLNGCLIPSSSQVEGAWGVLGPLP